MNIALIMGRKGSTGLPGKNTMNILGRPLAAYSFLAAKYAKTIDAVYISTDDERLMEIGRKHGANIIVRPPELASKEALGEHVYEHAFDVAKQDAAKAGVTIDHVALLMCNAATVTAMQIDEAVEILKQNSSYDSVVTCSKMNMWSPLRARREDENGLLQPFVPFETFGNPETLSCDRDSQGDVWFADMGLSLVRPYYMENMDEGLLPQKWMGQRIYPLKQWGGCDIDEMWQVPGVEFWLREHGFTENATPYGE